MKTDKLLQRLETGRSDGKKALAVLIDPDKTEKVNTLLALCRNNMPDYFFVGGSFRGDEHTASCIASIRAVCSSPIILFPGNSQQICSAADGILLLSVISSRNPDLLIGRHTEASLKLRASGLEIIPTGYVLIESGKLTTVQYMSQSLPVPRHKPEIAVATSLAGEQLGMRAIYLEAGSGAEQTVPVELIAAVRKYVQTILICGGGITCAEALEKCWAAGADIAVVGNALETDPSLIAELIEARNKFNA